MPAYLDRVDGIHLAYVFSPGRGPVTVFLPGFMSDMGGDKACALEAFCVARGRAFLRLDYAGHGASGGRFEDGTIGSWTSDALAIIDRVTSGPLLLVGSSMGGWIALLAALARPGRVAGLIGIAAAPDFTETLMWAAMAPWERDRLLAEGVLRLPSQYGGTQTITRALVEDGRKHVVLDGRIALHCPVRLLHGQNDPDVPWETSLRLANALESTDVRVVLVKDGDHRLSRPQDIGLLCTTLAGLFAEDGSQPLAEAGVAPGPG